jgi:trans-2,3-dihydro-3-hydroxyanthranilate isomerase
MRTYRYHRVDVFTEHAFGGNPLAVFPEAKGLTDREMQQIAREMNLSETVFCLQPTEPEADVRLRIFTVDRELALAGHPVVGTHFVLAATGRYELHGAVTIVKGQMQAGVLPVEIHCKDGRVDSVMMTQRPPQLGKPLEDRTAIATALGLADDRIGPGDLPARVVDTGIPWLIIPLVDLKALRAIAPVAVDCKRLAKKTGTDLLYAFTQDTEDPACAARARHVWFGTVTPGEDPVTGSAAGCLASYLVVQGVLLAAPTAEILIEQGAEVGRRGEVRALVEAVGAGIKNVRVGGRAVHVGDGELRIP